MSQVKTRHVPSCLCLLVIPRATTALDLLFWLEGHPQCYSSICHMMLQCPLPVLCTFATAATYDQAEHHVLIVNAVTGQRSCQC